MEDNNSSEENKEHEANEENKSNELLNDEDKGINDAPENNEEKDNSVIPIEDEENFKKEKLAKKKNFKPFTKDPYLSASCINKFFFHWAFKILGMSKYVDVKREHLGPIGDEHNSNHFFKDLNYIWEGKGYKNKKKNALILSIFRLNLKIFLTIFGMTLVKAVADFASVLIIKQLIAYFSGDKSIALWLLGVLFLVCQILSGLMDVHYSMLQSIFGNKAQFQLCIFIYHKVLRCAQSSFLQRASEGQIINFVQFDASKFNFMLIRSPNLLLYPIQIIAYAILLLVYFGLAFVPGIFVIIIFCIIGYYICQGFHRFQFRMLIKKDIRMKTTTEIIDNIKILKLYNWEKHYLKKILVDRKYEIDGERNIMNVLVFAWFCCKACPCILSCLTIGLYIRWNEEIDVSLLLIGITVFSKLQDPIYNLPPIIADVVEATVSLKRIEAYIRQPDLDDSTIHLSDYDPNVEFAIKIENGNFSWGVKQHEQKGAGMQTLPDELKDKDEGGKKKGKKEEDEKEDKIKNEANKLDLPLLEEKVTEKKEEEFDEPNEEGGEVVKDGCKIQIPVPEKIHYDVTLKNINFMVKSGEILGIIGEVGSGKSSLLQAVLNCLLLLNPKECDGIYINGTVGYVSQTAWIQNETIKNNILFFRDFDKERYEEVLERCQLKYDLEVLEGGDLTEIGEKGVNLSGGQKVRVSLARAVYADPDIYLFDDPISALDANIGKKIMQDLIATYLKGKTRIIVTHALQYLQHMDRIMYMKNGRIEWCGTYEEILNKEFFISMKKLMKTEKTKKEGEEKEKVEGNKKLSLSGSEIVKIIKEEDKEIGSVKFAVYIAYFKLMGGIGYTLVMFLMGIMMQLNSGAADLWLSYWTNDENQEISSNDEKSKWTYYYFYVGLYVSSVVFCVIFSYFLTRGHLRLSRYLHKDMIIHLVRAPINLFHDTISRGQIYNRLSKDLETILINLIPFKQTLESFLKCISSFVCCAVYDIYSLIYMPIVFVFGFFVTRFFLRGSRPITRLEAISRSPIVNVLSETLPGFASIKAFKVTQNYLDKYYDKINDCMLLNVCTRGGNMWLQEMFKFFSIIFSLYLVLKVCLSESSQTAQSVSVMFSYSIVLQENLGNCFANYAFNENNLVSLERCLVYTRIKSENPSYIKEKDDKLISENWPLNGEIRFENYYVKYRPNTEVVLKNLNFTINPREKLGIVGRTGSGKSTICLCLFRILEPLQGTIYIDGEDITKIGLDLLRQKLTIIPQDPCLTEGTLKYNIDPFNTLDNDEIISVLKKVGFEYTESDDIILDRKIEQSGRNLSVGEKQLICICRAILRKTKVIIMDEATASIDMTTEEKIQKALEYAFENSTVITVAHRIKTIINYDKILVLSNGEVAELDSPQNLIKDSNSLFYQLYTKSTV